MFALLARHAPLAALLAVSSLSPSYLASAGDDGAPATAGAAASVVQVIVAGYRPLGTSPDTLDTVRRTEIRASGVVVDERGAMVGLTTCTPGADATRLAVPASAVALAVPQLEEFGHLHRARLGLTVEAVSPAMRRALDLGDAVARLGPADPVVLQVEREGALTFLSADARR